jgi:hypothetical protein
MRNKRAWWKRKMKPRRATGKHLCFTLGGLGFEVHPPTFVRHRLLASLNVAESDAGPKKTQTIQQKNRKRAAPPVWMPW